MPAPDAMPPEIPPDRAPDPSRLEHSAGIGPAHESLPMISVVVPTFDRPRELAACIAALAALDYPVGRYEIVVVDDGSDPPVAPIAAPGRPGLRTTWLRQPNAGPSAARNAGARAATGEILAFTDDDCTPARGWLRALADSVQREPGALHGGIVENALVHNAYADASQTILDVVVPHLIATGSALRFVTSNNLAMTAERFRASGGFDERYRWAEDREFCQRCLRSGMPILSVPSAIVNHRHDLTLRSYVRQHFGYGRGAYDFHSGREAAGMAKVRPDLTLLGRTFLQPFARTAPLRAVRVAALLVLWQIANAAGYAWQRMRARGGV
jgi:glycosyltransferase involved in cell wall biosynthesis